MKIEYPIMKNIFTKQKILSCNMIFVLEKPSGLDAKVLSEIIYFVNCEILTSSK